MRELGRLFAVAVVAGLVATTLSLLGGLGGRSSVALAQYSPTKGVTKRGTPGPDVLRGTVFGDVLSGLGGNDRLVGLAGNDVLSGGAGADILEGGRGRDYLRARDGERDVVRCGLDVDTAVVDRRDRVVGCERVLRR
jgi:Ca2+-binding RTX toxin-like protein